MPDLLVFLPACFAVNMAFGPNNLLAMNHGAQKGVPFAFSASLARLCVFIPMITASALGLGLLLSTSALIFTTIKFIGSAYLVWLGFKLLRSSPKTENWQVESTQLTLQKALRGEALVAISNPKAILVFTAFFPQFIDTSNYWVSYLFVGSSFIILEAIAILTYATIGRFAAAFAATKLHWFQRASGGGMIAFGLLLFLSQPTGQSRA